MLSSPEYDEYLNALFFYKKIIAISIRGQVCGFITKKSNCFYKIALQFS